MAHYSSLHSHTWPPSRNGRVVVGLAMGCRWVTKTMSKSSHFLLVPVGYPKLGAQIWRCVLSQKLRHPKNRCVSGAAPGMLTYSWLFSPTNWRHPLLSRSVFGSHHIATKLAIFPASWHNLAMDGWSKRGMVSILTTVYILGYVWHWTV